MKKIVTILAIVALGFVIYLVYQSDEGNRDQNQNPNNQQQEDGSQEKTFESDEFSFSIEHPEDWENYIESEDFSPMINFYNPDMINDQNDLPFDHFANETHVSVYPKGIPTENVIAQSISVDESNIDFPYELSEDSKIFVLENGQPFAAYLKPVNNPDNWNSSGFIWARIKIDNLNTRCERDGEEISEMECDPLVRGDQILWNGSIDQQEWVMVSNTVESFKFSVDISNDSEQKDIIVEEPNSNEIISSPLSISGEARGTWLFEANAPVVLVDWDGRIISESYIEAEGDWMTTSFVPFSGTLEFEEPEDIGDYSDTGTLIFRKANPSGLPENDDAYEVPVRFR